MAELKFARRMKDLRASEIREILKLTLQEDMISFAGGMPAPEAFPVKEMAEISQGILQQHGREALQYSTTEGYLPLREKIADRLQQKFKISALAENILITCGSQQALDFSGKLFLDEGDVVLCENPTYLAAISAFKAYGVRFRPIPCDRGGMILSELKKALDEEERARLIYVIPDFQNPTGICWSEKRRQGFMDLVGHYDIPVLEDNPYGELRFEGEMLPALASMDKNGQVISTGTFSKTFCPGLRIGWLSAPKGIFSRYVLVKQGGDLCTSLRSQMEIAAYMEHFDFEAHIASLTQLYKERRDIMFDCLCREMPPEVLFEKPAGGLFLWLSLPQGLPAENLLQKALTEKVAFIPGNAFFVHGGGENTLRLNYSNMPDPKIREGIRRLAAVIRKEMQKEQKQEEESVVG